MSDAQNEAKASNIKLIMKSLIALHDADITTRVGIATARKALIPLSIGLFGSNPSFTQASAFLNFIRLLLVDAEKGIVVDDGANKSKDELVDKIIKLLDIPSDQSDNVQQNKESESVVQSEVNHD